MELLITQYRKFKFNNKNMFFVDFDRVFFINTKHKLFCR